MKQKIFIVEDELLVVEDLTGILEGAGYAISGHATSGEEALSQIRSITPDLILLDVKLKGQITGLDVAKAINGTLPFLFITSVMDARSLDEIASLAAGAYLLKPFVEEELIVNVRLALSRNQVKYRIGEETTPVGFMVRDGTTLKKLQAHEIAFAKGDDNYTRIILVDGKEHLISHTLKAVEAKLTGLDVFYRVHKSYVVNLNHLKGIEGQNLIMMDKIIPIGKSYRSGLFERFDIL